MTPANECPTSSDEFPELSPHGEKEAAMLIERFKAKMKDAAEEILGDLYVDLLPHINSDSWVNYREECRLALQKHYITKETAMIEEAWASMVREAIFKQFRPELEQGIIADLTARIKHLEEILSDRRRL